MERVIHRYMAPCHLLRPSIISSKSEIEWFYSPIAIIDQICGEVIARYQIDEPRKTFVALERESIIELGKCEIDSREELGKR